MSSITSLADAILAARAVKKKGARARLASMQIQPNDINVAPSGRLT
jgi:hypothetical protein